MFKKKTCFVECLAIRGCAVLFYRSVCVLGLFNDVSGSPVVLLSKNFCFAVPVQNGPRDNASVSQPITVPTLSTVCLALEVRKREEAERTRARRQKSPELFLE